MTALAGFLFLVCGSVVFTLNYRELYYREVRSQNLEQELGLSEETIRANYDVLIDYNLAFGGMDVLEFPDFPMSEHGKIHFAEVKEIFIAIQYLAGIMGILFLLGAYWKIRAGDRCFLKQLAGMAFLIPTLLGTLAGLNWEQFFTWFHRICFSNDYWLFDPVTDPVILILPDTFFAHCAVLILALTAVGGIISLTAYVIWKRKNYTEIQKAAERRSGGNL